VPNTEKPASQKRKPLSKLVLVVAACIVVVAVVFCVFYISKPSEKPAAAVCGKDVVAKYNAAFEVINYEESKQALSALASDVSKKSGVDQDATCQYIVFMDSYEQGSVSGMEQSLSRLKNLKKNDHSASEDLYNVTTLEALSGYLKDVKDGIPNVENGENKDGVGYVEQQFYVG
jgi:hypothetical protein